MVKSVFSNSKGLVQSTGKSLQVNTQMAHGTVSVSAAGPSSPDVANANVVLADTSSNTVTLGGLKNGITGQVVYIVKTSASNNLVLENQEGDDQNFLNPGAGDLTLTAVANMLICVYDGTNWVVSDPSDKS